MSYWKFHDVLLTSFYENKGNLYKLLKLSFLLLFIAFISYRFYIWRLFVAKINKISSPKLRFYNILGHASSSLYYRLFWKRPLPIHIYDFNILNGICKVFSKESLVNFWTVKSPFLIAYKADSVEMILNHSTQLEKAWYYNALHSWIGTGLLVSHGSKWRNRRKLLTLSFHFNILKDFLPVFNKQSRVLVDILNKHTLDEYINIVPFVTKCSLDIICETILGAEIHSQNNPNSPYLEAIEVLTKAVHERAFNPLLWPDFLFKLTPEGRKFFRSLKHVHEFAYKLIKERKETIQSRGNYQVENNDNVDIKKGKALLDLLVYEHVVNNSLSEEEIREEVDTFTFEGHDTTSMASSFSLYLIGLHPEIQDKIREELESIFRGEDRDATMDDLKDMKYLDCVIKESLRVYPSVPFFGRKITEDIEFQGKVIPAGSTCTVFNYQLHRDPEVFPNPEKFDPDRFLPENCASRHPFAYVPFSAGPRNCIGQRFAMMELKVLISSILRKYRIRSIDPRDKVHLSSLTVLRPYNGIRIEIRPANCKPESPSNFFYSS